MNNLKILVIEDEQELLEKYQILIEEEIADINLKNIKTAQTKEDAIDFLYSFNPNLVLLDLSLPMDQSELARHSSIYSPEVGVDILFEIINYNLGRDVKDRIRVIILSGNIKDPLTKKLLFHLQRTDIIKKAIEKDHPNEKELIIENIKSSFTVLPRDKQEVSLDQFFLGKLIKLKELDEQVYDDFKCIIENKDRDNGSTILNKCNSLLGDIIAKFNCDFEDLRPTNIGKWLRKPEIRGDKIPQHFTIYKLGGFKAYWDNKTVVKNYFHLLYKKDAKGKYVANGSEVYCKSQRSRNKPFISKNSMYYAQELIKLRNYDEHNKTNEIRNLERLKKQSKIVSNPFIDYKRENTILEFSDSIIAIALLFPLLLDYMNYKTKE